MKRVLFAVALLGLFCLPLYAQDTPKAQIFGGYGLIHEEGFDAHGFTAEVEGNVSKTFGIAGDFGFGRVSQGASIEGINVSASVKEYLFMGGPRFSYGAQKGRAFFHYLVGGMRMNATGSASGLSAGTTFSGFAMAIGGGVDISLNDKVSIRPAMLDWLRVRSSEKTIAGVTIPAMWGNQIRYSAGIVFKLGKKT